MSPLSKFMHTARTVLDDHERMAPSPDRPPVFVRTNYLYVEIDEAIELCARLSHEAKIARLKTDIAETKRLTAEIARVSRQLTKLCAWADEQFKREAV
jgi:hypothetical protein